MLAKGVAYKIAVLTGVPRRRGRNWKAKKVETGDERWTGKFLPLGRDVFYTAC